jgi:hypothetical protein
MKLRSRLNDAQEMITVLATARPRPAKKRSHPDHETRNAHLIP